MFTLLNITLIKNMGLDPRKNSKFYKACPESYETLCIFVINLFVQLKLSTVFPSDPFSDPYCFYAT